MTKAIICDIDGTISIMGDRGPFDYEKCHLDTLNEPIGKLVRILGKEYLIIFVSGREETCRKQTWEFIKKHFGDMPHHLYMRTAKDYRKDSIVKKEIYENLIKDHYDIEFVIDDRNQVVDMWRKELNLTCLQVNYGDF